jgi:hypothetical protein
VMICKTTYIYISGWWWLEPWNFMTFHSVGKCWEFHHPNWRTHIFFSESTQQVTWCEIHGIEWVYNGNIHGIMDIWSTVHRFGCVWKSGTQHMVTLMGKMLINKWMEQGTPFLDKPIHV